MINTFILLLGLLALSAFFSASETAFLSISKAKALDWAKEGGRIGGLIQRMKDDPHRLFTTLRIGNHLANIAASSLATTSDQRPT